MNGWEQTNGLIDDQIYNKYNNSFKLLGNKGVDITAGLNIKIVLIIRWQRCRYNSWIKYITIIIIVLIIR